MKGFWRLMWRLVSWRHWLEFGLQWSVPCSQLLPAWMAPIWLQEEPLVLQALQELSLVQQSWLLGKTGGQQQLLFQQLCQPPLSLHQWLAWLPEPLRPASSFPPLNVQLRPQLPQQQQQPRSRQQLQ
jgi:hypothetical protein